MIKITDTAYNCKKSTIRWNNIRWNTNALLKTIGPNKAFVINRSKFLEITEVNPGKSMRGYIGVQPGEGIHMVIISEDKDMDIFMNSYKQSELSLYLAHYRKIANIQEVVEGIPEPYRTRVERWQNEYAQFILTINSEIVKTNTNGIVRVFDIPGDDLFEEFKTSECVLGFLGLKDSMTPTSIELIFVGVTNPAIVNNMFTQQDSQEDEPVADFTTPRPPFNSELGYGLL